MNRLGVVQLDLVTVQATTGNIVISDVDLQDLVQDNTAIPPLKLLHDTISSSNDDDDDDDGTVAWQVQQDTNAYDGSYVLNADTRQIVRSIPANSESITTYSGKASMSMTLIAGPFGGMLHFAFYSQVHTPIDVLEVRLDDSPILAATSPNSEWKERYIEIPQGQHIVTFIHISNPANLPISILEQIGQPGSSSIDGLRYVDNIDPALVTPSPTSSPTPRPSIAPTVYTIPPQNYCSETLSSIQDTCWTVNAPTCNDDDPICPSGTFCWGNVACQVPLEFFSDSTTFSPTTSEPAVPSPVAEDSPSGTIIEPQNYCGTSMAFIKENCASGTLPTCNDDDGPCPPGLYCWGNILCDVEVIADSEQPPEPSPVEEDDQAISFSVSQEDQQGCPQGMSSPLGLPGCCVPDPHFLGDGACDAYAPYNTAACNFDFGDCCRESCNPNSDFKCAAKDGDAYGPFGYYCIDPRYKSSIIEEECNVENREWIGDGGCDPEYNTEGCAWDGGDCCRETCDIAFAYYDCGREAQPFDCKSPDIIYRADYNPDSR